MTPLSQQQRLFLVESTQLYEAWAATRQQMQSYKYGMKWLKSKGGEYLVRLADAKGNGKSLGPRNPRTEAIYHAFVDGKQRYEEKFDGLGQRLMEQARLNKAVRLDRLPIIVGNILRAIDATKSRDDFRIIGTHALFAYEALAGVQLRNELLASGDVDLLYDPRKNLSLVARNLDGNGLLGLLQKVDKSFALVDDRSFRAVNNYGFMVDLIVPAQDMRDRKSIQFAPIDLHAVEAPSLQWLTNAPYDDVVVISGNGLPVRARVPDPRAFAVHKAWLAQQLDREPVKKARDLEQARMVFAMLREFLPNYPLDPAQMRYFPLNVIHEGIEHANNPLTSPAHRR